ncbi:hypothetical protein DKX38_028690 [Salix brachista]|uniref:Pentatricopeptide repeat-containing protein n=1 Tax=Salix brachista TaxID=2182728 RepID=A0A5N5J9W7_9ROSI|nr:hypothetical protein DKX38_028690 [Salix brachista]
MISALAFHGQAQQALSLFRSMSKDNGTVHPNDITFIGVLAACVHAGLVDEGRQLFESMSLSFGLVPKVEHYSCIVDLCARAGPLYEAWDLIKKMPGKPDEIVLGSLLGACQRCRNADVGERCGVSKTPGCSWIDIGALVHEFMLATAYNIICIDCGGVRDIIPTEVPSVLESKLSTGGLMPSMLTAPNDKKRPLFASKDIAKFYQDHTGNMIKLKDMLGKEGVITVPGAMELQLRISLQRCQGSLPRASVLDNGNPSSSE